MTNFNFAANVRFEAHTAVIEMHGDINGFSEADMNAAYSEADQVSPESVTLDFSKVEYINSTGIALIVGLLARARTSRRAIIATGLSDHYREIFTITRLSDFMDMQ
jgi:anti-anti-sigma factor